MNLGKTSTNILKYIHLTIHGVEFKGTIHDHARGLMIRYSSCAKIKIKILSFVAVVFSHQYNV